MYNFKLESVYVDEEHQIQSIFSKVF